MVSFTRLVLAFVASTSFISAAPANLKHSLTPDPAGMANGVYTGKLLDDGTTQWTLVAPINETISARTAEIVTSRESTEVLGGLEKRNGPSCNSPSISLNSFDVAVAEQNFQNQCGSGLFFDDFRLAVYYNSAVAFGCNYGNGQTCHSGDFFNDMQSINRFCGGSTEAGWYSHNDWKASYGRTASWASYC